MADPQTLPQPKRSVDLLIDKIESDKSLVAKIASDPISTLDGLANQVKRENPPPPPTPASEDKFSYRVAVVVLSLVTVLIVLIIGAKFLLIADASKFDIPQALVALGSMSLGALAGLLMPSPRKN